MLEYSGSLPLYAVVVDPCAVSFEGEAATAAVRSSENMLRAA